MADILHRVGIRSSLDQVYRALTTQQGLAGWWTNQTMGEGDRIGNVLAFRFNAGGFDIRVVDLKPSALIRWEVVAGPEEWVGTAIEFELKQDGDYVIVLFKHRGWREPVEFMYHCSTKWAVFLMSLKSLVESGKGSPEPNDVKIDNWN